jgi:hypothetical protein
MGTGWSLSSAIDAAATPPPPHAAARDDWIQLTVVVIMIVVASLSQSQSRRRLRSMFNFIPAIWDIMWRFPCTPGATRAVTEARAFRETFGTLSAM